VKNGWLERDISLECQTKERVEKEQSPSMLVSGPYFNIEQKALCAAQKVLVKVAKTPTSGAWVKDKIVALDYGITETDAYCNTECNLYNTGTNDKYTGDIFTEQGMFESKKFFYTMGKDLGYTNEKVDVKCKTKDDVSETATLTASQTTKCAVSMSKTTIGTAGVWPTFDWGATGNAVSTANGLSSKDAKNQCLMTACEALTTSGINIKKMNIPQFVTVEDEYPFNLVFKSD